MKNSTSRNMMKLRQEAQETFVDSVKSGELGELILFVLAEKFLKLPQVICKMNLKTSSNMHFHGADGVFLGKTENNNLALYWGESKIYEHFSTAVEDCLNSLNRRNIQIKVSEHHNQSIIRRRIDEITLQTSKVSG